MIESTSGRSAWSNYRKKNIYNLQALSIFRKSLDPFSYHTGSPGSIYCTSWDSRKTRKADLEALPSHKAVPAKPLAAQGKSMGQRQQGLDTFGGLSLQTLFPEKAPP